MGITSSRGKQRGPDRGVCNRFHNFDQLEHASVPTRKKQPQEKLFVELATPAEIPDHYHYWMLHLFKQRAQSSGVRLVHAGANVQED